MIETEASGQKTFGSPRPSIGYGNFLANTAPTISDDESQGYSINSVWYKQTVPYRLWVCTDNTEGAAIWREIPLSDYRNTRTLFENYVDAATTGTTQENFYAYTLPSLTLFEDGDKIQTEYSGIFTANANTKRVFPKFAGTVLATGQTSSATATDWTVDAYIIRVSNTVVRFGVEITSNETVLAVESGEITGLDLDSTNYQIDLDARSVSAAGEVTAHSGFGIFFPAAPVPIVYVQFLGTSVEFSGSALAFNP